MDTLIIKANDKAGMKKAGDIIRQGGLVAFPTETVYGLGGDAFNPSSSKKIYAAKGRPSDNPLIVHIAELSALNRLSGTIPDTLYKLADAFWPGPLTMIIKKLPSVPDETTGGLDTVAIRMPHHHVALELIREGGGYIAAPSANASGRPSPTLASH
ncbi:MAG: threonylcarbamoyl-AMP synthase, partial [Lachnospiraceae bacterium]|nr:threonylcarbamoyl-AMP synthase [Lachnospiraceae bacterium]